jgi:hypothetical protein
MQTANPVLLWASSPCPVDVLGCHRAFTFGSLHAGGRVDEKIPALGGKTPRQAIRTKHGRQSVAALIDQIERGGQDMMPPLDPTIVRELRQTLKIDAD